MKTSAFVIFVIVVVIVYSLANVFLFFKGYKLLPDSSLHKYIYTFLFLFLSLQFFTSRMLLLSGSQFLPKFVFEVGGIWFAAVLYFLLISLLAWLINIADHFFHFLPDLNPHNFYILIGSVSLVFVLLVYGFINANSQKVTTLHLKINKKSPLKQLRIAFVSDIHYGTIIAYNDIKKMLDKVTAEKPDMLIFGGDFADEGADTVRAQEIKPLFDNIKLPLGVFAILGNHEYIHQINKTFPIFKQLNITLIKDSFINIGDQCILVGRDDASGKGFSGKERKPLKEILKDVKSDLPIILLDHQPTHLEEAAENGVDLELCGHTHQGQMFPLNIITHLAWEVNYGYLKKGNTQYFVSSGYGTWGPRIRIGNTPEIVIFNLSFEP